jgi:hypothetical protein
MFLTVYVDESGTHGRESPVTILAGHVGEAWQWRDFEKRWDKLLAKYNVSHVHGIDLRGRRGEFRGWFPDKQDAFVREIHDLMQRRTRFGFVLTMRNEDYDRFYVAGERPKKIPLDSRYGLAFRQLISWLSEQCHSLWPGEKRVRLNVVMESGHANRGDVDRILKLFRERAADHQRDVVGTVTFADKKSAAGLQAADMLAYVFFREERDGNPEFPPKKFQGKTLKQAQSEAPQKAPLFRLELTEAVLRRAKQHVLDEIEARRAYGSRRTKPTSGEA